MENEGNLPSSSWIGTPREILFGKCKFYKDIDGRLVIINWTSKTVADEYLNKDEVNKLIQWLIYHYR